MLALVLCKVDTWKGGDSTLQLLQHAVDGARAAAAGHADVEDVFVLGAGIGSGLDNAGGGIHNIGHCVWCWGGGGDGGCCLASRCSELSVRGVVGGGVGRVGFSKREAKRLWK